MKKAMKYISMILLAAGSFSACSLDTESMTTIDSQTFYKTMEDAKTALVGCYDGYRRTNSTDTNSFVLYSEVMGDDCFGATGNGDGRAFQVVDRFDQTQSPGDLNIFETMWQEYYSAIFNVNSLLVQLDNITWEADTAFNTTTPEETRAAVEGEARFLRALEYFELARLFERVPLLTAPSVEVVPQAEPDAIYAQIVADLKFAAENIKYNPTREWHKTNDGRATAEAAKALLARVYLFYTGYYGQEPAEITKQEVIDYLEDIVEGGNYGLVQTLGEDNGFKRLWAAAVATDAGDGMGLNYNGWAGRGCNQAEVNEFIFTLKFNYFGDVYNSNQKNNNRWLCMMGLRGVSDVSAVPLGIGWGACTVNPDAVSVFESGDARKEATIVDFNNERQGCISDAILADWREFTYYGQKKYIPLSVNVGGVATYEVTNIPDYGSVTGWQESQYQDVVLIRYADVLLMLAELKEDATPMNEVRARAGLAGIGYSKEALLEERHREFMCEGIRYWDVLRQGVDYAAETLSGEWDVLSGGAADKVVIKAENIRATRGFSRIPDNQIALSGNVYTQNAGWE